MVWAGELGTCVGRVLENDSQNPSSDSHNASRYTDTDGVLEHLLNQGSLHYKVPILKKVILGFLGPPSYFRNAN